MPGGGPFMVDAGQFTDDSELSMCLMHGLINGTTSDQNQRTLDLNSIAEYYGKWIRSDPFDIGNTTKSALTILKQKPLAKKAIRMAQKYNTDSLSNGSLMKIQPMILYASAIQDRHQFCQAIISDV